MTEMITTKQQERNALNKIRKIIEGLGENSYVGTALAGCIEIADQNIEYDFGDSLQERLQIAENKLRDEIGEKQAAKRNLEKATAEIEALKKRTINEEALADISRLLASKTIDLGKEVCNAAERIVEAANHPESAAFQNAVKDHRAAKADLEHFTALLLRVNTAAKAVA